MKQLLSVFTLFLALLLPLTETAFTYGDSTTAKDQCTTSRSQPQCQQRQKLRQARQARQGTIRQARARVAVVRAKPAFNLKTGCLVSITANIKTISLNERSLAVLLNSPFFKEEEIWDNLEIMVQSLSSTRDKYRDVVSQLFSISIHGTTPQPLTRQDQAELLSNICERLHETLMRTHSQYTQSLRREIEQKRERYNELQIKLVELTKNELELQARAGQPLPPSQEINKKIMDLINRKQQAEAKKLTVELKREQIMEDMQNYWKLTLATAKNDPVVRELEKIAALLENHIDNLSEDTELENIIKLSTKLTEIRTRQIQRLEALKKQTGPQLHKFWLTALGQSSSQLADCEGQIQSCTKELDEIREKNLLELALRNELEISLKKQFIGKICQEAAQNIALLQKQLDNLSEPLVIILGH